jgi:hypothetical protein
MPRLKEWEKNFGTAAVCLNKAIEKEKKNACIDSPSIVLL